MCCKPCSTFGRKKLKQKFTVNQSKKNIEGVFKMKCFQVIEQLQELIINSSKIPLSNKVVVNQDQILSLFDELVRVIPDDIKDAQKIIEDRQRILIEAQQEGEIIVEEAQDTIDKMINQDEITKLARKNQIKYWPLPNKQPVIYGREPMLMQMRF